MDKTPVMYSPEQMDEIEEFIYDQWGGEAGSVIHELQSEYLVFLV